MLEVIRTSVFLNTGSLILIYSSYIRRNEFATSRESEAFWPKIFLKPYWRSRTGADCLGLEKEAFFFFFLNIGKGSGGAHKRAASVH